MNRQQAQEILLLYRPETDDAHDPAFTAALELAHQDHELARWLENHRASYKTVRGALKAIPVPAGLKQQIISERPSVAPRRAYSWKKRLALPALSVVVLLFFGALMYREISAKNDDLAYRNRMVSTALRSYGMDLETSDLNQIRAFLAGKNAPADIQLPGKFQEMQLTGCVVLRWQNQPVSMICFRTGRPLASGERSDLFLFIMDKTPTANDLRSSPNMKQVNRLMTASWSEGNKSFLLASPGSESFLRELL